jgi:propanol-preferring alcohol dehydrogenase
MIVEFAQTDLKRIDSPSFMKAAVVHEFGRPLIIEEVPVPSPGTGEVLVKVMASGVCHTDLYAIDGLWPVKPRLPFIPGHEIAGHVVGVGMGVTSVNEGDRVGVPWLYSACGRCDDCLSGCENVCARQQNTGYSVDGGYAEYVIAPAAYIAHLPAHLGFLESAPILCAGLTPYKGLKETGAKPGEWVVIVGLGGLGHLAVQYANAMGLHVAAVDVVDEKLAVARELGAEVAINAVTHDTTREIRKQIGGAHGVLITSASLAAFQQGINLLRRRGTCVFLGLPPGECPVSVHTMVAKQLTLKGSTIGTRKELQEALQFAAEGKVNCMIEVQPLDAINDILDRLRAGRVHGRVVLQFE